ncbi:DUF4194 domain-containing protein [Sporomusa sphaeroides DSM 2875]|uniref:DUF4194 domain-containing protein n=1 Tax=Sporomusa sphaeroides TaxID=47679 RepID=UPI00202E133B|nr:DUF4194 domain-containing protein [Sporomusa sphaeroides]MCM0760460.1 DUF4194 domain-containing protein [Sporomusa sphaeroides DSM 2875]
MNVPDNLSFSRALVALFKNVVFKESDPEHWEVILAQKYKIEDYVSKIGLTLMVDEMDGYGYLKQRSYGEGEAEIPRLVPRHALSYPVSLLFVLLRKQLLEFDSTTGDRRLIVTRQQLAERMRLFLKDTTNEAKMVADIDKHIDRIENMGFLRRLRGSDDSFEVQRILRSFVNAEWLHNVNEQLDLYRVYAGGETGKGEEKE